MNKTDYKDLAWCINNIKQFRNEHAREVLREMREKYE
jgi:hypothetical protein